MKKRTHRKLELSKDTLCMVDGGVVQSPGKGFEGGGSFSCLTCYISCAQACDTNIYCN